MITIVIILLLSGLIVTNINIKKEGAKIMSKISEFAQAVAGSFDTIAASVDGLTTDVKTLNDKITELQNSSGVISPEDQALLDEIQAEAQALAGKLATLDDQTSAPPAPPVEPNP